MIAEIDCASGNESDLEYYRSKMEKAGLKTTDINEYEYHFLLDFEWAMLEKLYHMFGDLIISDPYHDDRSNIRITIYDDYIEWGEQTL